MKVCFLIGADAFGRLEAPALDRGWRSDPEYARRLAERFFALNPDFDPASPFALQARTRYTLDYYELIQLAAMSGEFETDKVEDVVKTLRRFFGEWPRRLEIDGTDYVVDQELGHFHPVVEG
ncbi:MAG: hypothetical protein IT515_08715 [Burkholderiales bacterium]|nr:hypothetical protein [Burkholderiales bacterium]